MQDLLLIPTRYKTKLPHTLSYPLGAEALSIAFADVPQFEQLKVRFWWYSREKNTKDTRYRVLHIGYSRSAPTLTSGKADLRYGWIEKSWEITVSPVHRERRHFIKSVLEREALPLARKWLIENAGREEFGGLTLTFSFDEKDEALKFDKDSWLSPKQA